MDTAQILTIALTASLSFVAVMTGALINNARITDLRADLHRGLIDLRAYTDARTNDLRDTLRAEMKTNTTTLEALIEKNHSETMFKLAELEQRLGRLEAERRVIS